jgi:trehalose synthase
MALVQQVEIAPLDPNRFEEVLSPENFDEFEDIVRRAQDLLKDRIVWNVNSTAYGGGVAEMLRSLIAYARGAGIDARWMVVKGEPDFFRVTKRIHNRLHGAPGDGGNLGAEEHRMYEDILEENGAELASMISAHDVVILHDPQTAGLTDAIKATGATVIWRCHVGLDTPNDIARDAWEFLRGYLSGADAYVFSREAFAWEKLPDEKITIIPPSIDAFSPKNQEMTPDHVTAILQACDGIQDESGHEPTYLRVDGSEGRVERKIEFAEGNPPPPADAKLVVQVSRWDRLKDPVGVIEGFARYTAPVTDARLVVAGPSVTAVADDPEGAEVLQESLDAWKLLDADIRERVHLANLPMDDGEENAAIVNALQRRANVVVQKSLAEGFGLTVAEAMWKGRAVVATKIGGIQDQIADGETGVLIDDPKDLEAYGKAVAELISDAPRAERLGRAAQARVRDEFLATRHLGQYVDLIAKLD